MHAERLLTVARHRDLAETESTALRRLVRLRWELGDRVAMAACTNSLIELTDILPRGEELGHAMACIAQSAMLRDRTTEAIEWADRAIALADELDLPHVRVWAECEKGSALLMVPDRMPEGIAMLERAAVDAERLGEYVIAARALNDRARTGPFRRDPDLARAILSRMQRLAEKAGFDSLAGPGYWEGLASLAEWDGDLDEAVDLLDQGHRRGSATMRWHSTWYAVHEAGLALEVGDIDKAQRIFEDLRPGIGALEESWYGLAVHIACSARRSRRSAPHVARSRRSHQVGWRRRTASPRRRVGLAGRGRGSGRGAAVALADDRGRRTPDRCEQCVAAAAVRSAPRSRRPVRRRARRVRRRQRPGRERARLRPGGNLTRRHCPFADRAQPARRGPRARQEGAGPPRPLARLAGRRSRDG